MAVFDRAAALWSRFYFLKDLRLWAFGAACTAFFWGLASVSSAVAPSAFDLAVRGEGLHSFSTAFVVLSPSVDQGLLVVGFAYILFVMQLGVSGPRLLLRLLLAIPAVLLTFYFLLPPLLLPLGGLGIFVEMAYIVTESDAVLGASPGKALAPIVLLMAGSVGLLSFLSAGRWLANAVDGVAPFSDWTWGPSLTLLSVVNQCYWLLPRLFLLLFLAWGVRLVLALYWDEAMAFREGFARLFGPLVGGSETSSPGEGHAGTILLVALLGAAIAGLYPYFPAINPSSVLSSPSVGASYYAPVQLMLNEGSSWALGYAYTHASPVVLFLTYSLAAFFGSADTAVRLVPALLAFLFAGTTYFFAKAALKDATVAATASLFAAFSYVTVVGVNAGLEDGWLAASVTLVFFTLFLTGQEKSSWRWVAGSLLASILIMPTHAWTWLFTMAVTAAFAIFVAARRVLPSHGGHLRFSLASTGLVLGANAAAYALAYRLGGVASPSGFYGTLASDFSLSNLGGAVGGLQSTLSLFLGGALDETVVVCFAIVGVITMADLLADSRGLLFLWLLVGSLGAVFVGFGLAFPVARILMLIPVQVFAAMGFVATVRYLSGLIARGVVEAGVSQAGGLRWTFVSPSADATVRVFVALSYISLFAVLASYALQMVGIL